MSLNLILVTWKIWWAFNNAGRWQMGFNSAFKMLNNRRLHNFNSKSKYLFPKRIFTSWKMLTEFNVKLILKYFRIIFVCHFSFILIEVILINLIIWRCFKVLLTCIRLSSSFFRMTLRTACNIRDVTPGTLTVTDTCIGYHVTRFEASRNVIVYTRYVSKCLGAGCGRGRGTKKKQKHSAVAHVIIVSCYKYGRYRHRCR
jgi:hypothetical protein